jgi:hypothetical protein
MKKIFENVGGNRFRLITESMTETIQGAELVREGLKKVFSAGGQGITYTRIENVGLGYIKDVTTARKCALQEAKELASQYGYEDDENTETFVKK